MGIAVPAPVGRLVIALATGCVSASSATASGGAVIATPAEPPINNWVVTVALPRQRISRISVGFAAGARGWATLGGRSGATPTLFYPVTPDPENPDLLVVDSPLTPDQVMPRDGRFVGVLAQDCERTVTPDECDAGVTLGVSGDGAPEPAPGAFRSVDLHARVVADTSCAPASPRRFTVERSGCAGAELNRRSDCPVEAARDDGYRIGPFHVLLAAWVGTCAQVL